MVKPWVKEEVKRDELVWLFENVIRWGQNNRQSLITGAGIFVLVLVGSIYLYFSYIKTNDRAAEKIAQIMGLMQNGSFNQGITLCDELRSHYRYTPAAKQALLLKAEMQYGLKQFNESGNTYKQFLDSKPARILRPLALSGYANSLESAGDFTNAVIKYEQIVREHPDHFLTPTNYFGLARCYLQLSRKDETIRTYEKIVTLYPGTNWQANAETVLRTLKPSNPAPVPTTGLPNQLPNTRP